MPPSDRGPFGDPLAGMPPELAARFRERAALRVELDSRAAAPAPRPLAGAVATTLAAVPAKAPETPRARIPAPPSESRADREGRALFDASVRIPDPDAAYLVRPDPAWPATVLVDSWLKTSRKPHLLIRGNYGVGKSMAAAMVVREWTRTKRDAQGNDVPGAPVSWMFPDQLVSAAFHAYDPASLPLHRHLVIDELGRERKADFADALLWVLNQPRMRIVITTNLSTKAMRERYTDGALVSRMNAEFVAITVPGEDRRATDGGVF